MLADYIFFGDSLTATFLGNGPMVGHPAYWYGRASDGPTWADIICPFTEFGVNNFAVGGSKTVDVLDAQIPAWKDATTVNNRVNQIAFVQAGAADLICSSRTPVETAATMHEIIRQVRSEGTQIVVLELIPMELSPIISTMGRLEEASEWVNAYNDLLYEIPVDIKMMYDDIRYVIESLDQEPLVDGANPGTTHDFTQHNSAWHDPIHPSYHVHAAMARILSNQML